MTSPKTKRCRQSRRNSAIRVPITFYHEGAFLVQRTSLGDNPIRVSPGGGGGWYYPYHAGLRGCSTKVSRRRQENISLCRSRYYFCFGNDFGRKNLTHLFFFRTLALKEGKYKEVKNREEQIFRPKKIDYVNSVTGLKIKCATRRKFFIFYFYINKKQNAQNNRHGFIMKQVTYSLISNIKKHRFTYTGTHNYYG